MSKLLADPAIANLVDREVTKAIRAERRRVIEELKQLNTTLREVTTEIRNPTEIAED